MTRRQLSELRFYLMLTFCILAMSVSFESEDLRHKHATVSEVGHE